MWMRSALRAGLAWLHDGLSLPARRLPRGRLLLKPERVCDTTPGVRQAVPAALRLKRVVCGCVGVWVCVCGGGLSPRAHKISDFNHSDMAEKRVWHLSLLL